MNSLNDIVQAINEKRISFKVREAIDNTIVIRIYSSEFQPSSLEIRVPFTKPVVEYDADDVAKEVASALLNGEIKSVKACCNYIVKVYGVKSKKEKLKGIFPTLKDAKEQIESMDTLFMGSVILYIDAPDGLYFYGEESRNSSKTRWYNPEELEEVLIYDLEKDNVVSLEELVTYEKWWEFSTINKMKQEIQHLHPTDEEAPSSIIQSGKRMSHEEMFSYIERISRTELLMEIKELSVKTISSRYLKAIRVSLIELGYDSSWVESEFRESLEAKYMGK